MGLAPGVAASLPCAGAVAAEGCGSSKWREESSRESPKMASYEIPIRVSRSRSSPSPSMEPIEKSDRLVIVRRRDGRSASFNSLMIGKL